ncbi:hypothetical protein A1O3_05682 [Capronia epimyces CBS 606.96]|uniref:6-phosphogluconate dehydrogenase NADP-binding domain-containing protein n=1 Tax=Capronia epimyces CBS 606.96 TaxID=1182542 RepID=W9XWS8_9EURO|nr:uncharacterized protein A1O3_05682 [Capronia epimyces CBS 606.96]EXJ85007.1 hypothetical protein A1O3_05682 [Capronia epimyces CBS 606.96]
MALIHLGLGSMGNAMAQNLQKKCCSKDPLRFFNRTAVRGKSLQALGAFPCDSVAHLVDESDIIFTSLSDDAALESIIQQIASCGHLTGKIIVDTTTVHPDTTKSMAAKLSAVDAQFVSAPVFGATPMAEAGQLLIAVAGPDDAIRVISPLLKGVIARNVMVVSREPQKATLLKTLGNFMIAGIMEIVAEAHVFADKTGLGSNILEDLIEQNFGALAYSDSRRMTTGVYCPGKDQAPYSDLNLALKDVGHGLSCAQNVGVKLGVAHVVLENLNKAKQYSEDHGGRALDSSSLFGAVRSDAGLDFRTDFVKKRDGEN